MSRRVRTMAGAAAAVLLLSGSVCGPSIAVPPSPTVGVITSIDGEVIAVRIETGDTYRFVIADPEVPRSHLEEHRRDAAPVRVRWEEREGSYAAISIEDA